jgi:hypothetical protein
MPTGYEIGMYRDLTRIADALTRIANAMDPPRKVSKCIQCNADISDYESPATLCVICANSQP